MWEPLGPLPASVYWRRRAGAAAVAVVAVLLATVVSTAFAAPSDESAPPVSHLNPAAAIVNGLPGADAANSATPTGTTSLGAPIAAGAGAVPTTGGVAPTPGVVGPAAGSALPGVGGAAGGPAVGGAVGAQTTLEGAPDSAPGVGTPLAPGVGAPPAVGVGANPVPGVGTAPAPGLGTATAPAAGTPAAPGVGVPQAPTPEQLRADEAPRPAPVALPVPVPPTGPVPCTNAMIAVTAEIDQPAHAVGQHPVFRLVITDTSAQPCVRDLDSSRQEIVVWSGDGKVRLWSSNDCGNSGRPDLRTLVPGQPVVFAVTWAGRTSTPGCALPRAVVPAGRLPAGVPARRRQQPRDPVPADLTPADELSGTRGAPRRRPAPL